MTQCIICGITIPEGYGQVCLMCRSKYGQQKNRSQLEDENPRLQMLLTLERREHAATRRKLEKADHDRKRYARRIRFEAGRHATLCQSYRALEVENKMLNSCVTQLERRLLDGTGGEATNGTHESKGQ